MSAAEALEAAQNAGVEIGIDGDDLVLEASAPPPAAVLDLLFRHKAEALAVLAATACENKLLAPTPSPEASDQQKVNLDPAHRTDIVPLITSRKGASSYGYGHIWAPSFINCWRILSGPMG